MLVPGGIASAQKKAKQSKRVKRPEFNKEDWQDVFFEDLFTEGLSGERPVKLADTPAEKPEETMSSDGLAWSKIIPRDTVENEVKALQQQLQKLGLSVSRFNTQFREIQQQFSLLSMMFGIIHEYDSDVRWKKYSRSAQEMFALAATKAKAPSKAAFEYSKLRKQDLQELVRGGSIDIKDNDTKIEWPNVIDRSTIMIRLDQALGEVLKPETADENQFKKSKDTILQQAHMVAAMGKVVTREDMDEADEDDYVKYADDMRKAASDLAIAIEADNYQLASGAVNRIEQSCNDCHGDWR